MNRRRTGLGRLSLLVLWLVVGLSWALASPTGSAPDDDFHLGSIWCAWGRDASGCSLGPKEGGRAPASVPALERAYSTCVALKSESSAACQFSADTPPTTVSSNVGGYPPGFYATLRVLASDNASVSVISMRMLVWTVCTALILAAVYLLGNLGGSRVLLAALAGLVPLGTFLFASTNPSSVLVAAIPATAIAVSRRETLSTRPGKVALTLAVLAALAAVMSRPDAPLLLAVALIGGMLMRGRPWLHPRSALVAPIAVSLIVILGLLLDQSQSSALTSGLSPGSGTAAPSVASILRELPSYVVGPWATTLGYVDVPMPPLVWAAAAVNIIVVVFLGFAAWSVNKGLAIGAVLISQTLGLVYLQHQTACCTLQARYFLPLTMVWLLFASMVPAGTRLWPMNAPQASMLWLSFSIANSFAMHQVLSRYTVGLNTAGHDLSLNDPQWWWDMPIPPVGVWLIGSVAFSVLVAALLRRVIGSSDGSWSANSPGTQPAITQSVSD